MGLIYKYTNSINGKSYIGQTLHDIAAKRWSQHKRDAYRPDHTCYNTPFYRAIRKHGYDNFTTSVVTHCPMEELNELEIKYVKEYNTLHPNGYNLTIGGNSGAKRCELTRKVMLKALIERHKRTPMSRESREKTRQTLLERNRTIPESVATKNKKSSSHRVRGHGLPRYVNVRIFPTRTVYVIGKHPLCRYKQFDSLDDCLKYLFLLDNRSEIERLKETTAKLVICQQKISEDLQNIQNQIDKLIDLFK